MGYPTESTTTTQVTQQFFTLQSLIENTYNGQRINQYDTKQSIIGIANKVYVSKQITLLPSYIDALTPPPSSSSSNEAPFITYNFDFTSNNASTIINNWVNQNTNGLIEYIIPENYDISSWVMVLMNAIYLNGTFALQFEKSMTSSSKFYSDTTRETVIADIHLMHQKEYFYYYSDGNYQYLKFEFTDSEDLFVLFALPMNQRLYSDETYKNGLITDETLIKLAINKLESIMLHWLYQKYQLKLNMD